MKNKFLVILPILVATILAATFVFGATTMSSPVAGGNYTGTVSISITADANGADNMTNVTCYYNSSGGAATVYLTQILNDSASDLVFTGSPSITALTETLSYNVSCQIRNSTTLNKTISVAGITFDSTSPTISLFDVKQRSINPNGLIEARCSYADAVGLAGTGSSFTYLNPAGTSNSLTADGNYQSVKDSSTSQEGNYVFTCYAIDRAGNTVTDSETTTDTGFTITVSDQTAATRNNRLILFIIIGIGAYLLLKKDK